MRGRADDIQPSSSSIARPSPIRRRRIGSLINAWNKISPRASVYRRQRPYTDECLTTSSQGTQHFLVRSRVLQGSETRAFTICSSQSLNRSGRTTSEPVPPPESSGQHQPDCRFAQNIRGIGAPRKRHIENWLETVLRLEKRTGLRRVPTLALEIIEWLDFRRSSP